MFSQNRFVGHPADRWSFDRVDLDGEVIVGDYGGGKLGEWFWEIQWGIMDAFRVPVYWCVESSLSPSEVAAKLHSLEARG